MLLNRIECEYHGDSTPPREPFGEENRVALGSRALYRKPGELSRPAYYCYLAILPCWPGPDLRGHFLPQGLVAEGGHQRGEILQGLNCVEECLEVLQRSAPDVAEPH